MTEPTSTTAETSDAPAPDIDRVDASDWPQRDFPIDDGRREHSVRVVFKQSVLNDIHQHGQATTDVEICGVLVGSGYRTQQGAFIYVEASIRGQHSDSKAAQVTFTGETWNHIHNELDALNASREEEADLQILGWYHTHPGFGIFLSGMDLFIHENYFSGEQQLALVYDPIGGDEGLFVWRNGKATRDGFLVVPDVAENPPPVAVGPPNEPMTAGADFPEQPSTSADDANLHSRLERIEKRQTFNDLGVFAAVALAIVVPLLMWLLWIEPRLPVSPAPTTGPAPLSDRDQRPSTIGRERPEVDSADNQASENVVPEEAEESDLSPEVEPTDSSVEDNESADEEGEAENDSSATDPNDQDGPTDVKNTAPETPSP